MTETGDTTRSRRSRFLLAAAKNLFLYGAVPFLLLWLLARPIGSAVRASGTAVWRILPAALGAIILNWLVYAEARRKRPSLLVTAHGALCLLAVVIIMYDAVPGSYGLRSALGYIGAFLALSFLLLLSFWLASRKSRPAHGAAVTIWFLLTLLLFGMAYQVIRDFEIRRVTLDTWLTLGFLIAVLLGLGARKILAASRLRASQHRAAGVATGRIVQIIGETHLDLDGDPVTKNLARIQYAVHDRMYETRADISRITTRRYGKAAFIGREVPVFYNPEDPASSYANRIDKHLFDDDPEKPGRAGHITRPAAETEAGQDSPEPPA